MTHTKTMFPTPTTKMLELAASIDIDGVELEAALTQALSAGPISSFDLLELATSLSLEHKFSAELFHAA